MHQHEKVNYVEYPARDLTATKAFFSQAFAWQFVDYGPDYTAFSDVGLDGGFYKADQQCRYRGHYRPERVRAKEP